MNRLSPAAVAGLAAAALLAGSASAKMIAPAPIPQRVALSDAVVVGKVTGFADKSVSAAPFPGSPDKVEYQVATVQVADAILGAKGMKEIKVGFIPPPAGGGPGRPGRRFGPNLLVDQEACLFLAKHADADFYVLQNYYDVADKKDGNFDKDVEEAKRCAKLIADPAAGLKAKEAEDRFLTAAMLVVRYKTPRPSAAEPKTEDVPAEESKQVLLALADADWAPKNTGRFELTPVMVFYRLGVTEKDGWKPPQDGKEIEAAAKKWLKDNADKYRVQKFVYEKKDKEEKKDGK
jgi:hypothetical protein